MATDKGGDICAFRLMPKKMDEIWVDNNNYREIAYLTPDQAIALCGRVPEWSDEEPTPVISQASEPEPEPAP